MVARGEFLEHAHVHGHWYGTSVDELSRLARSGSACVLDIDIQGIQSLWQRQDAYISGQLEPLWDELLCVAILPESLSVLEDRLRSRGSETRIACSPPLKCAHRNEFCSVHKDRFDLTIENSDSWEVGYPNIRIFFSPVNRRAFFKMLLLHLYGRLLRMCFISTMYIHRFTVHTLCILTYFVYTLCKSIVLEYMNYETEGAVKAHQSAFDDKSLLEQVTAALKNPRPTLACTKHSLALTLS